MHGRIVTLLLLLSLVVRIVLAGPTWGFEATLTNEALLSGRVSGYRVLAGIRDRLRTDPRFCPAASCDVVEKRDRSGELESFELRYRGGATLEWTVDRRVIEVKVHGQPRLADLEKWEPQLQLGIYDLGAAADVVTEPELHLEPHAHRGGGHEHLGVEGAFGGDSLLFRNFLVYHYNHPEIGLVTRGRVTGQGVVLAADEDTARREGILALIREFDALPSRQRWSIDDFARRFLRLDAELKEMEMNVGGVLFGRETLEIRSGGPFRNAHEIILRARLRERILEKLREETGPIAIRVPVNAPTPPQAIPMFGDTLRSLGLPVAEFLPLVHILAGRHEHECRANYRILQGAAPAPAAR